jgi:hypothetical protein
MKIGHVPIEIAFLCPTMFVLVLTKNCSSCSTALGGPIKADQTCFISNEALKNVLDGILTKFVYPLAISHLDWARFSYLQLMSFSECKYQAPNFLNSSFEAACFAFEVINRSLHSFVSLPEEKKLVASILAALFSYSWEYSMNGGGINTESPAEFNIGKMVHGFLQGVGTGFWADLDPSVRTAAGTILVKVIRFVIFNTTQAISEEMLDLYVEWVMDLASILCQNVTELQGLMDQLLSEEKSLSSWPFWVGLDNQGESRSRFVIIDQFSMEEIPVSNYLCVQQWLALIIFATRTTDLLFYIYEVYI